MAAGLRHLDDVHVEAVLLEDAGLLGERQRRKAGPARHADGNLGFLRPGRAQGEGEDGERDEGLLHGGSFDDGTLKVDEFD